MRGMDVMQFRLFALLVGITLVPPARPPAQMKDRVLIPAPIPDYGAVAVPGVVPVPEGFTYYLRADLGWGFATSRSYTENGAVYGAALPPFLATSPIGFGSRGFVGAMPRATACSSAPWGTAPTSRRASAAT